MRDVHVRVENSRRSGSLCGAGDHKLQIVLVFGRGLPSKRKSSARSTAPTYVPMGLQPNKALNALQHSPRAVPPPFAMMNRTWAPGAGFTVISRDRGKRHRPPMSLPFLVVDDFKACLRALT